MEMPAPISAPVATLRDRLRQGTIFSVLASGFGQGSTLVINIAVARILGQESFGQYALIVSTLLAIALIAQVATGNTATKHVAEFRSVDPRRASRVIGLCALTTIICASVASLALLLGADWVAREAMKEPDLAVPLRLGAAFVIFSCLNLYQMGVLAGLECYSTLSWAALVGGIGAICISIPATLLYGLSGAIAGLVLASAVRWGVCHYGMRWGVAQHGLTVSYQGAWGERAIIWKFSIPAAMSGFLTAPATWFANLLLIQLPGGFAQNALYNAAMNLKTMVMFLAVNTNSVGMSILSNQRGLAEHVRFRRLYFYNIAVCAALVILVGGVVLVFGPHLLRLYGNQFDKAWPVLGVLLFAALLESVSLSVYQIIQSYDRMWTSLFLIALPVSIVLPVLSYFLTPLYGAVGLALAVAATAFVHLSTTCVVAWQVAKSELRR